MGIWEALFGRKKIQEVSNEADAGFNSEFEVNQKNLKKIEAEEAAAETAAAIPEAPPPITITSYCNFAYSPANQNPVCS